MDKLTFGNSKAADSLRKMLDDQNHKGLTHKVSHIIHAFNKNMKDLNEINNNTLYYRCSTIIMHQAETEVEKIRGPKDILTHSKTVLRTSYREGLRKRGIIEKRKV